MDYLLLTKDITLSTDSLYSLIVPGRNSRLRITASEEKEEDRVKSA